MKIFISHKREDATQALQIKDKLVSLDVDAYIDLLDESITGDGKKLTDHIKEMMNSCSDIIVVISEATKLSWWVPFEVGMSAQVDMPTASFLKDGIELPSYLSYWPRLKVNDDLVKYVRIRKAVELEMHYQSRLYESASIKKIGTEKFYSRLKAEIN